MRLKGLKLHGFKSFADRTEFSFERGITCIVGPNGCGKSNVVDAVKWVLGEQRPGALRGDEMTDVIFGGTSGRKPVGFAEVALTFDNEDRSIAVDFAEVEVARRLHRDGTSEYLLNRAPCRLRDLRELLMDTGSGPGALTFMEQGRIDQILQESMQERRVVFEEAAGIAKYKARRKESLRRLERVEADLLRVSDVVAEKERLVRSLKIQAGRAERYQALVEEMRGKRLALAMHRYGSLLEERRAATGRVEELTSQEEAARAQVKEALGHCRKIEEDLETRRSAVSRTEQEIASLDGQSEAAREKAAFAARLASELDGKIRWYAGEVENAAARLTELSRLETEARESLARAESERGARRADLEAAEKEVERARSAAAGHRHAAQQLAERAYAVLARRAQLDSRRGKIETEDQNLASQAERLTRRRDSVAAESAAFGERLAIAEADAAAASERAGEGAELLAAGETRATSIDARIVTARESVNVLDREVSGARSRLDVLTTLEARREGVGEGAKRLLEESKKGGAALGGIRGLLAEMIETGPDDASAVETALGTFASAVVVATFEDAERAARVVVERKLGRCTFLPLDTVAVERAPVAGSLAAAVKCADDLRPVVDALLGECVSAGDLASARARRASGLRVVTAGGEFLDERGALTAGGSAGGAGILQRRGEARELKSKLEELVARLTTARSELAAAETAAAETRREISAAREAVRTAESALLRARAEVERGRADAARAENECERVENDLAEISARRAQLRDDAAGVEHEAVLVSGEETEVERARADALHCADEAETALRAADDARGDARVNMASVVERCSSLGSRAEAVADEIRELEANVVEARTEMAACEKRRGEADERGREAHKALEAAQKRRDRCIEELTLLRHQAAESHTQLDERRNLYEALESEAGSVAQELHRFKLRENEARLRVEGLIDRIRDELSVDLHSAWEARTAAPAEPSTPVYAEGGAEAPPAFDPAALETEISEIKTKIDRMGAVNLEALTQLTTEEADAKRLAAQHEDLVKSREALLAAIKTIDAECRERFVTTFEAIRVQFQDMFRRMFGGGKADVFLEEGADVLEAGIEIVARPPGKETRSIALLSGGERTMTAVALMFAIYLAKPSPFCLLDEVDAALDESNIDRFVGALTGFAEKSQFIIVTHNKRTMAAGNTIVGVSMPEPGVSRKIAVRLEDVGEDGQLRKTG
jgi:chromosome segregation protein